MKKVERVVQSNADGSVAQASRTTEITDAPASRAVDPSSVVAARVVWLIAGIIIALLAIRFAFILLGASTARSFVNFVYGLSYPHAAPFFGIFSYNLQYGVSRFEVSTLIAIAVYALIAWGIARVLTIRRTDEV